MTELSKSAPEEVPVNTSVAFSFMFKRDAPFTGESPESHYAKDSLKKTLPTHNHYM